MLKVLKERLENAASAGFLGFERLTIVEALRQHDEIVAAQKRKIAEQQQAIDALTETVQLQAAELIRIDGEAGRENLYVSTDHADVVDAAVDPDFHPTVQGAASEIMIESARFAERLEDLEETR